MLKRILTTLVAASFILGVGVAAPASASADTTTASNTLKSLAQVNMIAKILAEEAKFATAGCLLNKSVTEVLKVSKAGRTPTVTAARAVVALANTQGNGFCKATVAIAKAVALLYVTYAAVRHVYIKQVQSRGWGWLGKLTITRWIGPDASHTAQVSYTA